MLQCGGILGAAENTVTQILEVHYNEQVTANKGNSSGIWKTIRRALPKKSFKLSWPEASCVTFLCYVHELIAKRVIVTIGYSS